MNEEEGFLRSIRENPDNDVNRLVYADWLAERGDPREEYLRLSVQLPRIRARFKELEEQLDPRWLLLISNRENVVLVSFPPDRKINTIKIVRELTNLGLKEAKDLVEALPAVVVKAVSREEALRIQQHFMEFNAEVRLEPA